MKVTNSANIVNALNEYSEENQRRFCNQMWNHWAKTVLCRFSIDVFFNIVYRLLRTLKGVLWHVFLWIT